MNFIKIFLLFKLHYGGEVLFFDSDEKIEDNYIVKLKENRFYNGEEDHLVKLANFIEGNNLQHFYTNDAEGESYKSKINHIYDGFNGYSGQFNKEVLDFIKTQKDVEYIEADQTMGINYSIQNTTTSEDISTKKIVQKNAPWGLARITNPSSKNNRNFVHSNGGKGVSVYVIDTGVNVNHVDFGGRARWGITVPRGDRDIDGNGHGTHVAGTVGGFTYGVAKSVEIVAVKVLRTNGQGSNSDIIRGVEWAVNDSKKSNKKFSVFNLSIGGGVSRALNEAINRAYKSNIFLSIAAGNENQNACNTSPASAELSFTVGATDVNDSKAAFSNWGRCVDIFAPGHQITSTWIGNNRAINTISGTSMAAPHVAGVAAYIASKYSGTPSNKEIWNELLQSSIPNVVRNLDRQSPNKLLFLRDP